MPQEGLHLKRAKWRVQIEPPVCEAYMMLPVPHQDARRTVARLVKINLLPYLRGLIIIWMTPVPHQDWTDHFPSGVECISDASFVLR